MVDSEEKMKLLFYTAIVTIGICGKNLLRTNYLPIKDPFIHYLANFINTHELRYCL